jgi:hypothetical protein
MNNIDINTPIIYEKPKTPSVSSLSPDAYKKLIEEVKENNNQRLEIEKQLTQGYQNGKSNPPNVAVMAQTFMKSMGSWAKSGFKTVTEEQLKERLEICAKCEFWDKNSFAGTGRCLKCGCSTQAKLRLATEKCPIDKWGKLD